MRPLGALAIILLAASNAAAVANAAQPTLNTYSLVETTSLAMVGQTIEIYRDGDRAMMEQYAPKQADGYLPPHTRTYYNFAAGRSYTLDLDDPLVPCAISELNGNWVDPFAGAARMSNALTKQPTTDGGREILAGIDTKILVASTPQGPAKLWIDPKSNLLMKWRIVAPDGKPTTVLEVSKFSTAAPPAALLAIPAACTAAPKQDQTVHLTAAPSGGEGGIANAIMPPASAKSCTALFRVVRPGSMAPFVGGYQIAIDRTIDNAHPASYRVGLSATGGASFAGGGLKEETAAVKDGILRIEDMPPQIHAELCFGKGGCSSALIYRHCTAPESTLVFLIHNPARVSDGGDWFWLNAPAK
jgi:hypothetical protein